MGLVLHLHRLLLSEVDGAGGRFKADDNVVVAYDESGRRHVRFQPTSAAETPQYVKELIERVDDELRRGDTHPLLVAAAFVLDLLCIHPFADGNGRVARLATTHLLTGCGYGVVRYVSLEQQIYESKNAYDEALAASTAGWFDDGRHALWPWAEYLLARLAASYDLFEARVAAGSGGGTKQDRVRDFALLHGPAAFRIADIRRAVPGVSDQTIRLVLGSLKAAGLIDVDSPGRSAIWRRR